MESLRTRGILLRTYKLTETSLIVHWLTRDYGKLKTVAKGARRPKSPFRGRLDLFFCDDLQFLRSKRSELHILQEVDLIESFRNLRSDLPAYHLAIYALALCDAMTELESPVPEVFALLESGLTSLNQGNRSPTLGLAFEFRLLAALGSGARTDRLSSGLKPLLGHLLQSPWPQLTRLKISPLQWGQLNGLSQELFGPYLRSWPPSRAEALGIR